MDIIQNTIQHNTKHLTSLKKKIKASVGFFFVVVVPTADQLLKRESTLHNRLCGCLPPGTQKS